MGFFNNSKNEAKITIIDESDAREINRNSLIGLIRKALEEKKWIYLTYYGVEYTPKELYEEINKPNGRFFNVCNYHLIEPSQATSKDLEKAVNDVREKYYKLFARIEKAWDVEL